MTLCQRNSSWSAFAFPLWIYWRPRIHSMKCELITWSHGVTDAGCPAFVNRESRNHLCCHVNSNLVFVMYLRRFIKTKSASKVKIKHLCLCCLQLQEMVRNPITWSCRKTKCATFRLFRVTKDLDKLVHLASPLSSLQVSITQTNSTDERKKKKTCTAEESCLERTQNRSAEDWRALALDMSIHPQFLYNQIGCNLNVGDAGRRFMYVCNIRWIWFCVCFGISILCCGGSQKPVAYRADDPMLKTKDNKTMQFSKCISFCWGSPTVADGENSFDSHFNLSWLQAKILFLLGNSRRGFRTF